MKLFDDKEDCCYLQASANSVNNAIATQQTSAKQSVFLISFFCPTLLFISLVINNNY